MLPVVEHPLPTRLLAALSSEPWSMARHSYGATTKAARGFGRAADILPTSTQMPPRMTGKSGPTRTRAQPQATSHPAAAQLPQPMQHCLGLPKDTSDEAGQPPVLPNPTADTPMEPEQGRIMQIPSAAASGSRPARLWKQHLQKSNVTQHSHWGGSQPAFPSSSGESGWSRRIEHHVHLPGEWLLLAAKSSLHPLTIWGRTEAVGQGQGQAGGHTTARTASAGTSHPQAAAGARPPAGDSRDRLRSSQLGGSRFAQSKMNKHELALKRPQIGDVSCSIWAEQLPGGCMGGSDECRSKSTTSTKPTRDCPGVLKKSVWCLRQHEQGFRNTAAASSPLGEAEKGAGYCLTPGQAPEAIQHQCPRKHNEQLCLLTLPGLSNPGNIPRGPLQLGLNITPRLGDHRVHQLAALGGRRLREQASTSEIPPCKRALRNIPVQTPPPKSQGPCVFPHPVSPPSCWPHAGGTADATPGIAHLSTRKQKNKRKVCPGTSNKQLEEHEEGIRGAELHTPMGESPHLSTMACGHHPGAWATSVLAHQAQPALSPGGPGAADVAVSRLL
ncbi:hypothetical protein Anapl_12590 [Anas platyrhynchos]|uniref:Uncharacterized protein n=1 Tax=Anas platyrhynchos TaxID=8839 RepID=R0KWJ5_ANAPL|nr:hypothetical protein Anapl_12590 [Anas platyrhynchos]